LIPSTGRQQHPSAPASIKWTRSSNWGESLTLTDPHWQTKKPQLEVPKISNIRDIISFQPIRLAAIPGINNYNQKQVATKQSSYTSTVTCMGARQEPHPD